MTSFINRIQHIWLQLKLQLQECTHPPFITVQETLSTPGCTHETKFTKAGIPTFKIILFKTRKVSYQVIDSYCFVCTLESLVGIIKGHFNIILVFTKRQISITIYIYIGMPGALTGWITQQQQQRRQPMYRDTNT